MSLYNLTIICTLPVDGNLVFLQLLLLNDIITDIPDMFILFKNAFE